MKGLSNGRYDETFAGEDGDSVETAIRTFMFGCLFSIFHHAIKNVSLIENTDQTFSL